MTALPRRIWIVGPSGSGKSTLADTIAARLGVAAIHLDDLHWQPGWVEMPRPELVERVGPITAGDAWVIDGNYTESRRAHGSRAELFVWLDLPFATTFPRIVRRTLSRIATGERICNGNRGGRRGHVLQPRVDVRVGDPLAPPVQTQTQRRHGVAPARPPAVGP